LGILGIENQKPKLVNCKLPSQQQLPKKNYFIFFYIIFLYLYFFLASAQTVDCVRRGGGRGGREGMRASARTPMSARTLGRVRVDASVLSLGNFITDATVRPSHGRPSGHCPSIRPSVRYHPRDNPVPRRIHYVQTPSQ
jgi:hypothetical protein